MNRAILIGLLVGLLAGPVLSIADDPNVTLGPRSYVVAHAAQGDRGDLVRLPGGTVEGVHVVQGGTLECNDPDETPPCPTSGIRRLSLNLDIGAGDSQHRGALALNFDVGRLTVLFDGHKHAGIRVSYDRRHDRPRVQIDGTIDLRGTVRVNGRRVRTR